MEEKIMNWYEAKAKIKDNIKVGTDFNTTNSHYRFVKAIEENKFIIPIGKSSNISISWEMIEKCFQALNGNGYNGKYFRKLYPAKAANHPCHVHVIGQIFVAANIAFIDKSKYVKKK